MAGPPCPGHEKATYPTVCLPAGEGEDKVQPNSAGVSLSLLVQLVNGGPAVNGVQFAVTLPAPLRRSGDVTLISDWYPPDSHADGPSLACTPTAQGRFTCTTGRLVAGANRLILVPFEFPDGTAPLTRATPSLAVIPPAGASSYPSTAVSSTYEVQGMTHLQLSLTPAHVRVVVGQTAKLTLTLHNASDATATSVYPYIVAITGGISPKLCEGHFAITNDLPPRPGESNDDDMDNYYCDGAPPPYDPPYFSLYFPRSVAPGRSVTVDVTVRARTVGTDVLSASATNLNDDVDDDCTPAGCELDQENTDSVTLVAVSPSGARGSGSDLADTGPAAVVPQITLGLVAILSGLVLQFAARRRRRRPAHGIRR